MKRSSGSGSSRRKPAGIARKPDPEVVGFIAAVLRQMDHAADLLVAFFRSIGMLRPHETSLPALPGEFLLELAALLQLREWETGGVIEWFDPKGLSLDDRIGNAIKHLANDPVAFKSDRRGTNAMNCLLRQWNEGCAPSARSYLNADMGIRWDHSLSIDDMVDAFATFLCRHRDAAEAKEAI